jgi:hypothetical protein
MPAPAFRAAAATEAREVSMLTNAGRELPDDRDDAIGLGSFRHAMRTGAGGFTADIDDVGAFLHQGDSPGDRVCRPEECPTVREGIGSDIEDAHDQGAVAHGQTGHASQ